MGLNFSKRIEKTLLSSPEFAAACDAVYSDCLSEAQHAFAGVRPYQLLSAAARLHSALSPSLPLVRHWLPSAPTQAHVDSALRRSAADIRHGDGEVELDRSQFEKFAVEVLRESIEWEVGKVVLRRVPIGAAGIAGRGRRWSGGLWGFMPSALWLPFILACLRSYARNGM